MAAGGGRDCTKCGITAYQKQKHVLDENGVSLSGLERVHSSWITPEILAMQRPHGDTLDDLIRQFKQTGITAVFNLTEPGEHPFCGHSLLPECGFSYSPEALMAADIKHFNWNWPDMTAPSVPMLHDIVQIARQELDAGGKVAIHCHAGYGRTGTVAACLLLQRPLTDAQIHALQLEPGAAAPLAAASTATLPKEALVESGSTCTPYLWQQHYSEGKFLTVAQAIGIVRTRRPGSLQTSTQLSVVQQYNDYLCSLRQVFSLDAVADTVSGKSSSLWGESTATSAAITPNTVPASPVISSKKVGEAGTGARAGPAHATSLPSISTPCRTGTPPAPQTPNSPFSAARSPTKTVQQSVKDQLCFLSPRELQSFHYANEASAEEKGEMEKDKRSSAADTATAAATGPVNSPSFKSDVHNWLLKYVSKLVVLSTRSLCEHAMPSSILRAFANGSMDDTNAELLAHLKRLSNTGHWTLLQKVCLCHTDQQAGTEFVGVDCVTVLVQLLLDWIEGRADVLFNAQVVSQLARVMLEAQSLSEDKDQLEEFLSSSLNKPQLYLLSELVGVMRHACSGSEAADAASSMQADLAYVRLAMALTRAGHAWFLAERNIAEAAALLAVVRGKEKTGAKVETEAEAVANTATEREDRESISTVVQVLKALVAQDWAMRQPAGKPRRGGSGRANSDTASTK